MDGFFMCIKGLMVLLDVMTYHSAAVLLSYLATTLELACKARPWMMVSNVVSVLIEICMFGILYWQWNMMSDEILVYTCYVRRLMGAITIGILLTYVVKYKEVEDAEDDIFLGELSKEVDAMIAGMLRNDKGLETGDKNEPAGLPEQPANFFHPNLKKIGFNRVATMPDLRLAPDQAAACSNYMAAVQSKYLLRDRKTLLSPNKFTVPNPEGGKGKAKGVRKGKSSRRSTAEVFSSDDEI